MSRPGHVGVLADSDPVTTHRPLLVDLYCKAGGAGTGYQRAGFDVLGVDHEPQPHYPFPFVQADALTFLDDTLARRGRLPDGRTVAAWHASPPCQQFTAYRRKGHGVGDGYPNLIPDTRVRLQATGRPYVIENVQPARAELVDPLLLCGSMFALDVQRHRLFETSTPLAAPGPCDHGRWTPRFPPATNRTNLRKTVEVGVWRIPLPVQQAAMGIDWMTLPELSEAIPPAYTEHLGLQLLAVVLASAVENEEVAA